MFEKISFPEYEYGSIQNYLKKQEYIKNLENIKSGNYMLPLGEMC